MTDPFAEHRDLLFTVAYEMLGSAADAEDVVQEAWLRWREVDPEGLLGLLAPDVVLVTDGGGIKKAALRPIVGVEKVLRFLSAVRPADLSADAVMLNGEPCLVIYIAGELDGIFATRVVGGVVTELYGVRNPEKLSRLADPVPLSR